MNRSVIILSAILIFCCSAAAFCSNEPPYQSDVEHSVTNTTERIIYFPVRILLGGSAFSAGIDYYYQSRLRISFLGGGILSSENQMIAFADFFVYYSLIRGFRMSLEAGFGGFMYFPDTGFDYSPALNLEINYQQLFFLCGVRLLPKETDNRYRPFIGLGYRF